MLRTAILVCTFCGVISSILQHVAAQTAVLNELYYNIDYSPSSDPENDYDSTGGGYASIRCSNPGTSLQSFVFFLNGQLVDLCYLNANMTQVVTVTIPKSGGTLIVKAGSDGPTLLTENTQPTTTAYDSIGLYVANASGPGGTLYGYFHSEMAVSVPDNELLWWDHYIDAWYPGAEALAFFVKHINRPAGHVFKKTNFKQPISALPANMSGWKFKLEEMTSGTILWEHYVVPSND